MTQRSRSIITASTVAALQIGSDPRGEAGTLEAALSFEDRILATGTRLVVMPAALPGGQPEGEILGTRLGHRSPEGRETVARHHADAVDLAQAGPRHGDELMPWDWRSREDAVGLAA